VVAGQAMDFGEFTSKCGPHAGRLNVGKWPGIDVGVGVGTILVGSGSFCILGRMQAVKQS
jgi:hypothetical protein